MNILMSVMLMSQQVPQIPPNSSLDRQWWNGLSSLQKEAFISGEEDCYSVEVLQRNNAGDIGSIAANKIDNFFLKKENTSEKLISAIRKSLLYPKKFNLNHRGDAEKYKEKHGFFDGNYWWQLQENRKYFVSGYFLCKLVYLKNKYKYSPDIVAKKIDKFYGFSENGAEDSGKNDKIGDVLNRVASQ